MNTCSQLEGHFEVTCTARTGGESYLSAQSVRAPFHLSKPYWDGHALIAQCVNVTAGVFAGDRLSNAIRVEPGARLLLTSPSAHRIHTMNEGHAEMTQQFSVAAGAWLEVMPELFIPQARCRYVQRTRIDVEEGGELFFVETLAPGRVARGETFAFTQVDWELDINLGHTQLVRERYSLRPGDVSLWSLKKLHATSYYASCFILSPHVREDMLTFSDDVLAGVSRLPAGGISVKILAADSIALRQTLSAIREQLQSHLPALRANARKL